MPRKKRSNSPNLVKLMLGFPRFLYDEASSCRKRAGEAVLLCDDIDAYPCGVRDEVLSCWESGGKHRSRGDGSSYYLNASCFEGLIREAGNYTYTRYERRGVLGDAFDLKRFDATITQLISLIDLSPEGLGEKVECWAQKQITPDMAEEIPGKLSLLCVAAKLGGFSPNGLPGAYLYLHAIGDEDGASKLACVEATDLSTSKNAYYECRQIEWLWHENELDQALDRAKGALRRSLNEACGGFDNGASRLYILKAYGDVLDSLKLRNVATCVYAESLEPALRMLSLLSSLPRAVAFAGYHQYWAAAVALANSFSVVLYHSKKYDEADTVSSWALAQRRLLNKEGLVTDEDLAKTLNNQGVYLDERGMFDEAWDYLQEALRIRSSLREKNDPQGEHYHAMSLTAVASHHFKVGCRHAEEGALESAYRSFQAALAANEEALEIRTANAAVSPMRWRPRLAATLHNIGGCYIKLAEMAGDKEHRIAKLEKAMQYLEQSYDIRAELVSSQPLVYAEALHSTLRNLKDVAIKLDRCEAIPVHVKGDLLASKKQGVAIGVINERRFIEHDLGFSADDDGVNRATKEIIQILQGTSWTGLGA